MNRMCGFGMVIANLLGCVALHAAEGESAKSGSFKDREAATRLQIFLDRANFGPGKIDGRYGEFTRKALQLYREAHRDDATATAESAPIPKAVPVTGAKPGTKEVDLQGLDLASVDPVFIDYQVTEADLKDIAELPKEVPEMAKLKWLPYASPGEAIAEKFHCDLDFLKELNPGGFDSIKPGDVLKVPNVEPFEVTSVKAPSQSGAASEGAPLLSITIGSSDNMLRVMENEKLVAAYPVTIGSQQTQSPAGEWKIKSIARWPDFRYDQSFLDQGIRSDETHLLPPGPNNLVGVIWIALDRPGIGIHGTSEPDTIGRSTSHGCVRLANWDIVRLASRVRAGVPVSLQ